MPPRHAGGKGEVRVSSRVSKRWLPVGVAAAAFALLAGCAEDAKQDSLDPQGPISEKIDNLFMPILYIAGAVFVLVMALCVITVVKHRERPGRPEPVQVHGSTKLEIGWTIAPALLLAGIAFPTINTIFDLSEEPKGDVLEVNVYGHMWWWEYEYTDGNDETRDLFTANELHIPTGRPVRLAMTSIEPGIPNDGDAEFAAGVIHSFWVPKLAGKQDVVPGRINKLTIEAVEPGVYYGQCAEYCNLAHADMRLRVVAHTPEDFEEWFEAQQQPAAKPTAGDAAEGLALFSGKGGCVACHAMNGMEGAIARVGPDLTHLQSREVFAGATFDLSPENLKSWITNPSKMKPMRPEKGTGMPARGAAGTLTDEEIDKIVAYLETLK